MGKYMPKTYHNSKKIASLAVSMNADLETMESYRRLKAYTFILESVNLYQTYRGKELRRALPAYLVVLLERLRKEKDIRHSAVSACLMAIFGQYPNLNGPLNKKIASILEENGSECRNTLRWLHLLSDLCYDDVVLRIIEIQPMIRRLRASQHKTTKPAKKYYRIEPYNKKDSKFHAAIWRNQLTVFLEWMANGRSVNLRDASGRTPLQLAAQLGRIFMLGILRRHGAKLVKDKNGFNVAFLAYNGRGKWPATKEICLYQDDKHPAKGCPLIHEAVYVGKVRFMQRLLKNGHSLYETDDRGRTAFDIAALGPNYSKIRPYLERWRKNTQEKH